MRESSGNLSPTHKLFMATNHKPVIKGTDQAIWERMKLVKFGVTIPEGERDTTLLEKLQTPKELTGILAWAVRGCRAWQDNGLGEPGDVTEATAEYKEEMDVLGAFIKDCCEVKQEHSVGATDLYNAYKRWCENSGEKDVATLTAFGCSLEERGFTKDKVGTVTRHGLRLRKEPAQKPQGDGEKSQ